MKYPSNKDRILKRTTLTAAGCMEWNGYCERYGVLAVDGKTVKAHRFAWETFYGPIPAGMMVLHKCDNPPCCNPDHLFLGTQKDNMRDAKAKGRLKPIPPCPSDRRPRGESHWTKTGGGRFAGPANNNAKLSEEDINIILNGRVGGVPIKRLAEDFRVCPSTIIRLCAKHGVSYKPKTWSPALRAAQAAATKANPSRHSRDVRGDKNPRRIANQRRNERR